MAAQMVVPASKDTLFMRGFSARREIEDIRDFFGRDGGRCTVEFFKESDDKAKLYVALKFDSKEVAKELLNKYDNTDVLGDRITISWFKDLRRARMKAGNQRRRFNWSPDRYTDYRKDRYHNSGRYASNRWNNFGTRGRKFDRSSSRSRSRSSSKSRSRSPSPRRSRSHSNDSRGASKHKRSRTTSDTRKDDGRKSRSGDKEKGSHKDSVSRDRSESVGRHSREDSVEQDDMEEEDLQESRHSPENSPPVRNVKVIRSAVTTVERPQRDEAPSDDESEDGGDSYVRQQMSEDEIDKRSIGNHSIASHGYKDDNHKTSNEKADHRERTSKNGPELRGRSYKDDSQSINHNDEPEAFESAPKDREPIFRELDKEKDKGEERFYQTRRYDRDLSPHPPERAAQGPRYAEKGFRDQDYSRNFERMRRSLSPKPRSEEPPHLIREPDRGLPPGGDYPDSPKHLREREVSYTYHGGRDNRPDSRYEESPRDVPGNTPPPLSRIRPTPMSDLRDIRSPPLHDLDQSPDGRMRVKRTYDDDLPYERKIVREREYDDGRGPPFRREPDEFLEPKRRRFIDDGPPPPPPPPPPPQREIRREYYEDRPSRMDRSGQGMPVGGRMHMVNERERSPFFDDRASTGTASSRNPPAQSFNGSMAREVEKGALGLPQDKMALVREKKEEIEKSYRQDCETFAAVSKMLISKDGSLEDKLQGSLRENLKDIGQRCIHELREFIDRLKGEDDRRPIH